MKEICSNLQGHHFAGQKCEGYYKAATSIILLYCLHCCNELSKDIGFSFSFHYILNNYLSRFQGQNKRSKDFTRKVLLLNMIDIMI